ncbi:MAG: type II toxin-antitoxin system MqsA family antitoxin [Chloroflexi bacterium]|nr:type II toxin-antitoxin system MqsA family antitoxin [Chloroflexota bacterium]
MKCVVCKHGETYEGTATVTLTKGGAVVVVRGVPAQVCGNCGEEYVDQAIAARLSAIALEAEKEGVQVDVRRYVAA